MRNKIIVATISILAISVLAVGGVMATGVKPEALEQFKTNIASNQTINSSLYAADEQVTIAGTVNGDVYCVGSNLNITGKVTGDVICAGENVRVAGDIAGDVRVAGLNVSVGGKIGGSLTTFGETINVDSSTKLAKDFNGAGQTIMLAGEVGRDVLIGAEKMDIEGKVARNVVGDYVSLRLASDAKIGGELNYVSKNDADIAAGSVAGAVNRTAPEGAEGFGSGVMWIVIFAAIGLISALVVAIALVLIFPQTFHKVSEQGRKRFFASLAVGFLVVFATPVLAISLLLTVVGLPLAAIIFLVWLLVLMLSGPVTAYLVGRLVLQSHFHNAVLMMITGSLIVGLIYMIPIVGFFAIIAVLIVGSGMLTLHMADGYKKPVYKVGDVKK